MTQTEFKKSGWLKEFSKYEEVELATSAWLAVNVPGVCGPAIATTLDVLPSS